ncbi:TcpQ domain-containing protein [Salmonella enterica subsp. enterica serovar Chester]
MSRINIIVTMVMANALTACSAYKQPSDVNTEPKTGWIRFTEDQPVPKPVQHLPKFALVTSSHTSSMPLPLPSLQQSNSVSSQVVKSAGNQVPLMAAMHRLVPVNWRVRLSPTVAKEFKGNVSWNAGKDWKITTDTMLSEHGLKPVYNNQNKEIEIVFDTQQKTVIKPTSSNTGKPLTTTHSQVASTRVWEIEKGTTLITGFTEWMVKEKCPSGDGKWKLQRLTDTDYPIDYPLRFTGKNFEDVTEQLFDLYRTTQAPLYVSGYRPQCLIVISDKK